jgi:L-fuculose-phosphate aldolase
VKPAQLIITDLEGQVIQASTAEGKTLRPSSEFPLHLEVYRQRPEVRAVVHAHPPVSIALTVAGLDLETPLLPEVVVVLGTVPTAPYATPGTPEGAEVIRKLVKTRDAILLDHHGVVAVGSSPEDAYLKLEKVEHAATIVLTAAQLGRVIPLDRDQVERLIEIREAYGLLQPGDREQLCTKAKSAEVTGLETLIRRIVTEVLDTQSS